MLGKALAGKRHDVIVATKVRGRMGPGANHVGLSRLHIIESVEASLKRLDTDYIDLYQIHRSDTLTNIEDTLRALDDLVRAGKVRYIGCSNLPAWQLMKALGVSREQHLERFRCTQSYYSLAGRDLERDDDPADQGSGPRPAGLEPAGRRIPSGKFTRERWRRGGAAREIRFPSGEQGKRLRHPRRAGRIWRKTREVSPAQIALAWILANDAVSSVIIGARKMSQLDDNLKAIDITLTVDEMKALDDVSRSRCRIRCGWKCSGRIGSRASGATEDAAF